MGGYVYTFNYRDNRLTYISCKLVIFPCLCIKMVYENNVVCGMVCG